MDISPGKTLFSMLSYTNKQFVYLPVFLCIAVFVYSHNKTHAQVLNTYFGDRFCDEANVLA